MNQSKNFRNECYEIISFFSKRDKDILNKTEFDNVQFKNSLLSLYI